MPTLTNAMTMVASALISGLTPKRTFEKTVIGKVVDEELLSHLYGTSIGVVRTPQGDLFTRNA